MTTEREKQKTPRLERLKAGHEIVQQNPMPLVLVDTSFRILW